MLARAAWAALLIWACLSATAECVAGNVFQMVALPVRISDQSNRPEAHAHAAESGESCDPLCKRILRREKTFGPMPPLWFVAGISAVVLAVVLVGGFASYLLIGWITKPRNGPDKE